MNKQSMTDHITTEQMLVALDLLETHQDGLPECVFVLELEAIRTALTVYAVMADRLAKAEQERDAQVAEVAVLQVARDAAVDEFGIQKARAEKAEAALAEQRPLVEAVMETDILAYHDPDTDCPIITQALAYRAKREGK